MKRKLNKNHIKQKQIMPAKERLEIQAWSVVVAGGPTPSLPLKNEHRRHNVEQRAVAVVSIGKRLKARPFRRLAVQVRQQLLLFTSQLQRFKCHSHLYVPPLHNPDGLGFSYLTLDRRVELFCSKLLLATNTKFKCATLNLLLNYTNYDIKF